MFLRIAWIRRIISSDQPLLFGIRHQVEFLQFLELAQQVFLFSVNFPIFGPVVADEVSHCCWPQVAETRQGSAELPLTR